MAPHRFTLLVIFATLFPAASQARPRVALRVDGQNNAVVRKQLVERITAEYDLVDAGVFDRALSDRDVRPRSTAGAEVLARQLARAARDVRAQLVVWVAAQRPGRTRQTGRLIVVETERQTVAFDALVVIARGKRGRRLRVNTRQVQDQVIEALADTRVRPVVANRFERSVFSATEPPPWTGLSASSSATEDDATAVHDVLEDRRDTRLNPAGAAIDANAAFALTSRRFTYTDAVTKNLRPYSALFAPGYAARIEVFPMAFARDPGPLGDLGIEAAFEHVVGHRVDVAGDPVDLTATWLSWRANLRYRFHLDRLTITPRFGFAQAIFDLEADGALAVTDPLPEHDYRQLRAGVDAQLDLDPVRITAGASYLHLLTAGPLGDSVFPRSTELGFDGNVGVAVEVWQGFEAAMRLSYTHIIYDLQPAPGDAAIAGGALDQLFGAQLGVSRTF